MIGHRYLIIDHDGQGIDHPHDGPGIDSRHDGPNINSIHDGPGPNQAPIGNPPSFPCVPFGILDFVRFSQVFFDFLWMGGPLRFI